jgi:hypothetical protein
MKMAVLASLVLAAAPVAAEVLVYVDVDIEKPGIQNERTVAAGDTFPIDVVVGEDGNGEGKAVFDRILVGVYFNDSGEVLSVTADRRPHAMEMANNSETTKDALGGKRILALQDLTLKADEPTFPRGFRGTAGQAGLEDVEHAFEIGKGQTKIMARGKLHAGFTAQTAGVSTILATTPSGARGGVTLKGKEVAVRYVPAKITVLENKAALAAKLLVESVKDTAEAQGYLEKAVARFKAQPR